MKKILLLMAVFPFILFSCQSKEEKANELIKCELSKTLYDFDSYEPIETILSEAKNSVYTDSSCWKNVSSLLYLSLEAIKLSNEMEDLKENMDIWGEPTSYSSTYSDNKYRKYREQYNEKLSQAKTIYDIMKIGAENLKDSINALDTNKIVGWEVRHRFRCKTRGGHSTIGDYRYVINKDFSSIILREDTDDKNYNNIRELIEMILNGKFS